MNTTTKNTSTRNRWALFNVRTGMFTRKSYATRAQARVNKSGVTKIYDTYTGEFVR